MYEGEEKSRCQGCTQPYERAPAKVRPRDPCEGCDEHKSFETYVDDPAPLAEQTAEGGEDERCRVPDGGLEYRTYGAEKVLHYKPRSFSRWVPAAKSRARLPTISSTSFVAVTSSRMTASSTLAS